MFTKYILAETDSLPPIDPSSMYEFVVAGNGVFVRARRKELEALIPVARCEIRGLQPVQPYVRMEAGKVPLVCTQAILAEFQRDLPNESLIWLRLDGGRWKVVKPNQVCDENAVHPVDPFDPDGAEAFLDVHSHNTMAPFFSTDDDRDETGFRIFAVFGLLDKQPCVTTRIGIYSYYWHLNAGDIFVLPDGLQDAVRVMLAEAGSEPAELEALSEIANARCTQP
jgi:PRTRC genetic system protein A